MGQVQYHIMSFTFDGFQVKQKFHNDNNTIQNNQSNNGILGFLAM